MVRRRIRASALGAGATAILLAFAVTAQAVPMDYPPNPNLNPATPLATSAPLPGVVEGGEDTHGIIQINGVRTAVRIKLEHSAGVYRISGRDLDITLKSVGPAGVQLPLGADGSLLVLPGGSLVVSGKGFSPGSQIALWVLSSPVQLGVFRSDSTGIVLGSAPVPAGIVPGVHHAQAAGSSASGQELRATVPVRVLAKPLEARVQRIEATVYFDALDARVAADEKQIVDDLIAQVAPGARRVRVSIAGFVQPNGSTANDMDLSSQRATVVGRYLRAHGVQGQYVMAGRGISSAPGAQGRQARIQITVTVLE